MRVGRKWIFFFGFSLGFPIASIVMTARSRAPDNLDYQLRDALREKAINEVRIVGFLDIQRLESYLTEKLNSIIIVKHFGTSFGYVESGNDISYRSKYLITNIPTQLDKKYITSLINEFRSILSGSVSIQEAELSEGISNNVSIEIKGDVNY